MIRYTETERLALKIPQDWTDLLRSIQEYYPDAVIAGGAIRDLHFGLKPRDIDIVCYRNIPNEHNPVRLAFDSHGDICNINEVTLRKIFPEELWKLGADQSRIDHGYKQHELYEIYSLRDMKWYAQNGLREPVQIIFLLKPDHIDWENFESTELTPRQRLQFKIERMDFGICQIVYDGEAVYCSESFLKDKQDNTMTLLRCDNSMAWKASIKRFFRLRQKLGRPQLIIPDEVAKRVGE